MNYFKNIASAASTIFEGMTITFSHLLRKPITVQYPDKIDLPLQEMLFCRYRGFLGVDTKICMGCTVCMAACPIQCINIKMEKILSDNPQRVITKFDIDIGKCMFCGLCVEACPTGAIYFTREFEKASYGINDLTFKFIKEGEKIIPYKKGNEGIRV